MSSGIQTLVGMFPDIERSVISSLYEANDENMERTIENLLALQKGNKAARGQGTGGAGGAGGGQGEEEDDWFSFFTGGAEAPGETSDHWMDTMSADLRSKVNSFNDAVNETINYVGDLVTEVIYGEEDDDYMEEGNEKREDEAGAVSGGAGVSGRLKKRRTKPSGGGKAD